MGLATISGRIGALLSGGLILAASLPAAGALAAGTAVSAGPGAVQASLKLTFLSGVYCTSARNCYAVGERAGSGSELNQLLHWTGHAWHSVPVPNPGGTGSSASNTLYAVRCLTARNCWAVGEYQKHGVVRGQALHWNGRGWHIVATPAAGGRHQRDVTELFDVTCTASASCWAVGDYGRSGSTSVVEPVRLRSLALHWNGRRWSQVRTPNPAGARSGRANALFGVRCVSPSSCTTVGDYGGAATDAVQRNLALHWNGRRWSQSRTPNPGGTAAHHYSELAGLGCGSATSCWAAGTFGVHSSITTSSHNQILHWNGRRWSRAKTPDPADGELFGAVCASVRDCWAVGDNRSVSDAIVNQALHWNGKKWSAITTPDPAGTTSGSINVLIAARCTSHRNCWAVGYRFTTAGYANQILHWNGTTWTPA